MLLGTHERGFEPLAKALRNILLEPPFGGAAVCLYQHGRCVFNMWGGPRNAEGDPWQERTAGVSYSTCKGVTATALHILKDRGLLKYDDPVVRYWPEFAHNGKRSITVRHVLTHGAGLFDARNIFGHADVLLDWEAAVHALERAPASHAPGRYHGYHALTFGHLVGELVRRVSGKTIARFVHDEIAVPLGLRDFYLGEAPDQAFARAARNIHSAPGRASDETSKQARARQQAKAARMRLIALGFNMFGVPMSPDRLHRALTPRGIDAWDFSSPQILRASIPAANGLFSASDLTRFYALLANGGSLEGVRLLSESTVREATQVQVRGPDGVLAFPMRWSLGYHAVFSMRGVVRGAFGHSGYNGSGAWASPEQRAALSYVVNAGSGTPVGDWRLLKLTTTAQACLRKRSLRAA
jgi:CubicO group peptidase (beta-lactamase class C family)